MTSSALTTQQAKFELRFERGLPGKFHRVKGHPTAVAFALALGAALSAWVVFATMSLNVKNQLIAEGVYKAAEQQIAYENRLSSMRSSVDRLHNRLAAGRETIQSRILQLQKEQSLLQRQHRELATLVAKTLNSGIANAEADRLSQNEVASDQPAHPAAATFEIKSADASASLPKLKQNIAVLGKQQFELASKLADHTNATVKHYSKIINNLRLPGLAAKPARKSFFANMGGPYLRYITGQPEPASLGGKLQLIDRNTVRAKELRERLMRLPISHPVPAAKRISSRFGVRIDPIRKIRAMHNGVDMTATHGTPVYAAAGGRVIKAGRLNAYGRMVEIKHDNGITSRYAHLSRLYVKRGDVVEAQSKIGAIGSTGRSTGPHLHFETRLGGKAIDPSRFLQAGKHVYEIKVSGSGDRREKTGRAPSRP